MFNKMWTFGKSTPQGSSTSGAPRTKAMLSDDLHNEVRSAAPGARLTYHLRTNLERMDKAERKEIVSIVGKQDNCAPLFIACKRGNLEIVEYLIETCGADVEQKGIYEVVDEKTSHRVTPLWCSAVCGRLEVVKTLVRHGANVNAVSDTGSTPVRSACFMTHFEVVKFLVETAGADIGLPNFNGGTCLINSVQSSTLCEYLLVHGANVNAQDIQLKSALHYAIQEHRFDTMKLLIAHGADPFLKNRYGDDAFQTSCLKGATTIFSYLLSAIPNKISRERQAELHELMGSTFLDEHHDIQMALHYWRKAIEIRYDPNRELPDIPKKRLGYTPIYATVVNHQGIETEISEFNTKEELENIATDLELMRVNSLLIAERILGTCHKDMIFRIMYRGAAYADSAHYVMCVKLWRYAMQLRIQKDSLLYGDTCFTALALIRLYLDLDRNPDFDRTSSEHPLKFEDLIGTFKLLVDQFPTSAQLVKVRPIFKRQHECFDRCLRCCTHLLYVLLRLPNKTKEEVIELRRITEKLVRYRLRMCATGDTLLHLACSRANVIRSHFFVDDQQVCVFPSLEVVEYLIQCGANVNEVNRCRASPLHLAVSADKLNSHLIEFLLEKEAHLDQLDDDNISPLMMLEKKKLLLSLNIFPMEHVSLVCLAARAIDKYKITYNVNGDLPRELHYFVKLHQTTKKLVTILNCARYLRIMDEFWRRSHIENA